MLKSLSFLILFLQASYWLSSQAFATDVLHAIPNEFLKQFSRIEVGRGIIMPGDHSLTIEEREYAERSLTPSLAERCFDAITQNNRLDLWRMFKVEDNVTVRKIVEGSLDSMHVSRTSEIENIITNEGKTTDENLVDLIRNLVEGQTFFPTLVMNLEIHQRLAQLSADKHPLAQWYLSKILQYFSIKKDDELYLASQVLHDAAASFFQKALTKESKSSNSEKGLYCEYLGEKERAYAFFRNGAENGEALSHYKIAQRNEAEGNEVDALDNYEQAFILGYEKALYDVARLHNNDNFIFLHLKKAGERGNPEAYEAMAQMLQEGFSPILKSTEGEAWDNDQVWLTKGMSLGSISCALSLGELCERNGKFTEALGIYRAIADRGNIRGYLEQGKILEKKRQYTDCEAIYSHPNAGWFGLYSLAEITSDREKRKILKGKAEEVFYAHFRQIISEATQGL